MFTQKLYYPIAAVVGQIATLRLRIELGGSGASCGGHLGEQQRGVGEAALQFGDERLRGAGFAHGNGVYPDGLLHGVGMGRAEAFVPVFQISGVFAGAFAQIAADKWGGNVPKGVVENRKQHCEYGKQKIQAAYFMLGSLKIR